MNNIRLEKRAWSLQKFKVLPVLTAADGDGGVGPPTEKHKFILSQKDF